MHIQPDISRAIVVVVDGLRPDAVDEFDLVNLRRLAHRGASTMTARTVTPSITWSALASLLTGVTPADHGIESEMIDLSLRIPRPRKQLEPLPELLGRAGMPASAFMGRITPLYRLLANRIAEGLGFSQARFTGATAPEVFIAANAALQTQRRGLIFMHWADADRMGHKHGWMSEQYGEEARRLDATLGLVASSTHVESDPSTMLVVLADHGGGGVDPFSHDDEHPLNATIPLVFAGGAVRATRLESASLIDVPATIAWALGVEAPGSWSGRVLTELFASETSAVA